MKHNDVPNVSYKITPQNYENIFNVYQDEDGFYYYNILKTVNFPAELDPSVFQEYTTGYNDTWPIISWKFYHSVKLWWLICAANQIVNPVEQPKAGTVLKIINSTVARNILNNLE
jgi:hypothetical protein